MTTQVELLFESEVADQGHDYNVEALEIIKALGLDKQAELYGDKKGDTRFKYTPANNEQMFVYATMFPKYIKVEEFNLEPIPYRVLEVLKEAKESGRFTEFGILCDAANLKEDPVLIGRIKEGYNNTFYLLARWGNCLEEYNILKKKALAKYTAKINTTIQKLSYELKSIAEYASKGSIPNTRADYNGCPVVEELSNYLSSPYKE